VVFVGVAAVADVEDLHHVEALVDEREADALLCGLEIIACVKWLFLLVNGHCAAPFQSMCSLPEISAIQQHSQPKLLVDRGTDDVENHHRVQQGLLLLIKGQSMIQY